MNYFRIEIIGETPLNDEEVGKCLDALHDYVEYILRGECGISYTPTYERGDETKTSATLAALWIYGDADYHKKMK